MVINNTPGALTNVTIHVAVYNLDGSLQYAHDDKVTAAPSAATDVGLVAFPDGLSAVHFVKLELRGAQKKLLSDNFYWRETQQDNFQALNDLPIVPLTAHLTSHSADGKLSMAVTLHNPSKSVALMAHWQLRRRHSSQRVLPVFYSDNYLSFLPGESKTITVETAAKDLGNNSPLLVVDGWNVTVTPSDGIAPNLGAQVKASPAVAAAPIARTGPLKINCGGSGNDGPFFTFGAGPASDDGFVTDTEFVGGSTKTVGDPIDTNIPHAAPQSVYQSERWGVCAYTLPLPKLPAGHTYTVRLHFAETTYDAAGKRRFNVDINGKRVLTDLDVFAEAGGKDKALVKDFPGTLPDAQGKIIISFTVGSADLPKISGIEVFDPQP